MAELPQVNATQLLLEQITFPRKRGNTLPMSIIGDNCARKLWFTLHWAIKPQPLTSRIKNLFDTGTRAEDFIIADLERIGIKVTHRQQEMWGFMRHARGFHDGRCTNVPEAPKTEHLLEIKTHNDKNFKLLMKQKVRSGFPKHYAQCHRYMKAEKLTRTLYIGYNKNTSEYYAERLRYDASFANDLIRKEQEIIAAPEIPTKQFDASWYECKFCEFSNICHAGELLDVNCRTCEHSDMADGGIWVCGVVEGEQHAIPKELQETGCGLHTPMEIT